MRRAIIAIVLLGAAGGLCWLFPLFHIVPLQRAREEKSAQVFDAPHFADQFWSERLLAAIPQAAPLDKLLPAIQADSASAKKTYGHSFGMGDSYIYFLRGAGRIISVNGDEISIAVSAGATNAEVLLATGMIFGNALRDGTGLLSASDYPDSQDFNGIAASLNKLAEVRVLPALRAQVRVGAVVSFAGCAEVEDESTDLKPLKVVPLQAEVK